MKLFETFTHDSIFTYTDTLPVLLKVLGIRMIAADPTLDIFGISAQIEKIVVGSNFLSADTYASYLGLEYFSDKSTKAGVKKDANMKSCLIIFYQNLASLFLRNDREITGTVLKDFRRGHVTRDFFDCPQPGMNKLFDFR